MPSLSWRPAGDQALLADLGPETAVAASRRVRALVDRLMARVPRGLREAVPGERSVLLYFDPAETSGEALRAEAEACAAGLDSADLCPGREVVIPVAYGGPFGPDLDGVAAHTGLSPDEVVRLHSARPYSVLFLGFSPGFGYMGELPRELEIPRQSSPRTRVPGGSVGIAGRQTCVYPRESPGGWQIIGRTPLLLYDPGRQPPALLRQGDQVVFQPIPAARFASLEESPTPLSAVPAESRPVLRVERPGPLTTVQDLGRFGYQAIGVPPAGAADVFALRLTNRLLGNQPSAAALEITVLGPELVALDRVALAVGGADLGLEVDGVPVESGIAFLVRAGQHLRFRGPRAGCRAYLGVAGGVAVEPVLGSRSTDLLGGFGGYAGRPLHAGDVLASGPEPAPAAELAGRRLRPDVWPMPGPRFEADCIPGPQADRFELPAFTAADYSVSSRSDRMGLRLEGPPLSHSAQGLASEGTPLGTVQVPPDGLPIVLLAGRQTSGGYPKVAVATTPAAYRLAQALPGAAQVRFRLVDQAAAQRDLAAWERRIEDPAAVLSPGA